MALLRLSGYAEVEVDQGSDTHSVIVSRLFFVRKSN